MPTVAETPAEALQKEPRPRANTSRNPAHRSCSFRACASARDRSPAGAQSHLFAHFPPPLVAPHVSDPRSHAGAHPLPRSATVAPGPTGQPLWLRCREYIWKFQIQFFAQNHNGVPAITIKPLRSFKVSENYRIAPSFQIQITLSN